MAATSKDYRLEALKIANAVYGGKGVQTVKFLDFAAEIYEFIMTPEQKKEVKTNE